MATRSIIAARGKGCKNKATRDASAAPDNPVIAGTSEGQRHGDGPTSQRVETTRDEMSFQPSEVRSETLPESGTAPTTQASSPMWVNYPELGGNTPPSRMSPGIKEEAQAAIPEDGSVASMLSTPSRMLRRQGKQKEKGEGETTFASIRPMLQKLEDARRRPGFSEADWMTFVRYLAGITSLVEFEEMTDPDEPIMERL